MSLSRPVCFDFNEYEVGATQYLRKGACIGARAMESMPTWVAPVSGVFGKLLGDEMVLRWIRADPFPVVFEYRP